MIKLLSATVGAVGLTLIGSALTSENVNLYSQQYAVQRSKFKLITDGAHFEDKYVAILVMIANVWFGGLTVLENAALIAPKVALPFYADRALPDTVTVVHQLIGNLYKGNWIPVIISLLYVGYEAGKGGSYELAAEPGAVTIATFVVSNIAAFVGFFVRWVASYATRNKDILGVLGNSGALMIGIVLYYFENADL